MNKDYQQKKLEEKLDPMLDLLALTFAPIEIAAYCMNVGLKCLLMSGKSKLDIQYLVKDILGELTNEQQSKR